jgi:hypothetical protein
LISSKQKGVVVKVEENLGVLEKKFNHQIKKIKNMNKG